MTGFAVFYSDPAKTAAAGFGKVAHLPCIFDSRPGYHRWGSAYLIDRGLGLWHPALPKTLKPVSAPGPQTIYSYAHWLANFLEWAERRGVDLTTCDYADHINGRYQHELLKGYWSRDGVGLSANTVNLYVDIACDFLTWLSYKGHRPSFAVPTVTRVVTAGSAVNARGHRAMQVTAREGKVKPNKRRLKMPTDEQVRTWLTAVYDAHGRGAGLMCETVLMTGIRRTEAAAWRTDTLPLNEADWHVSNPTAALHEQLVRVELKFGTKGKTAGTDHGDSIGPPRHILLPLHFAKKLHAYRQSERAKAVSVWVLGAKGAKAQAARLKEAVHLFRDPTTGARVIGRRLYSIWTSVPLPFKGWTVHLGRDWWACSTLWREVKIYEHLTKAQKTDKTLDLVSFATNVIRMKVQPQLGHSHDSTSFIYLQWAMDMLGVAMPELYLEHLDGVEQGANEHSND